jgi:hypothetical protein
VSRYISKYAACPYYHSHDDNRICCEGTNSANTINIVFGDQNKLKEYGFKYCNDINNYRNCLICKALNIKYEVKG